MFTNLIINFLLGFLISLMLIEFLVFIFGIFKEEEKPNPKTRKQYFNIEKIVERDVKKIIEQMNLDNKKENVNLSDKENLQEVQDVEEESTEKKNNTLEELLKENNLEIIRPILDDLGVVDTNDLKLLELKDIQENINKKEDINLKIVQTKKLELLMKK